jgi:aminoglycoside phosphotransferase (APT) family kinase protein
MSLSVEQGAAAVMDFLERQGGVRPPLHSKLLDTPNGERLVAEFSFADAAGTRPIIAKCFGDDTGEHTFLVMTALAGALARHPNPTLALPAALCYDSARRCLVQQRVEGSPFFFLAGTAQFLPALQRAGDALADLHALDVTVGKTTRIADHLRDLIHPHPLELAERLPEHRTRIRSLVTALEAAEARFAAGVTPRPIHRDFHLRQLFLDEKGRVWVIDWDLFARGDPALDVGNFLMYLETRLDSDREAAAEVFLESYFGRGSGDVYPRIGFYKGLNYLRRASKHCRLAQPGWAAKSAMMLARAEACLGA